MAIRALNPWQVIDKIHNDTIKLYENSEHKSWHPAVDIIETVEGYVITMDTPGVNPEDVNIEVNESKLVLSGHRESKNNGKAPKSHYKERVHGKFNRTFNLPTDSNTSAITASFDQGVLNISIPKEEKSLPRKISVEVK